MKIRPRNQINVLYIFFECPRRCKTIKKIIDTKCIYPVTTWLKFNRSYDTLDVNERLMHVLFGSCVHWDAEL